MISLSMRMTCPAAKPVAAVTFACMSFAPMAAASVVLVRAMSMSPWQCSLQTDLDGAGAVPERPRYCGIARRQAGDHDFVAARRDREVAIRGPDFLYIGSGEGVHQVRLQVMEVSAIDIQTCFIRPTASQDMDFRPGWCFFQSRIPHTGATEIQLGRPRQDEIPCGNGRTRLIDP